MDVSILKDRLRGIVKPGAAPDPAVRLKTDPTSVEDTLDVASGFSRTLESLGGAWRETASGRSFVVTQRFAPDIATDAIASASLPRRSTLRFRLRRWSAGRQRRCHSFFSTSRRPG